MDVIFSESFSTPRIGQAIMNRMLKAAGHQVIDTHVKYDKIIFVAQTGTCREQMAKGIMNDFVLKVPMEIEANKTCCPVSGAGQSEGRGSAHKQWHFHGGHGVNAA